MNKEIVLPESLEKEWQEIKRFPCNDYGVDNYTTLAKTAIRLAEEGYLVDVVYFGDPESGKSRLMRQMHDLLLPIFRSDLVVRSFEKSGFGTARKTRELSTPYTKEFGPTEMEASSRWFGQSLIDAENYPICLIEVPLLPSFRFPSEIKIDLSTPQHALRWKGKSYANEQIYEKIKRTGSFKGHHDRFIFMAGLHGGEVLRQFCDQERREGLKYGAPSEQVEIYKDDTNDMLLYMYSLRHRSPKLGNLFSRVLKHFGFDSNYITTSDIRQEITKKNNHQLRDYLIGVVIDYQLSESFIVPFTRCGAFYNNTQTPNSYQSITRG